MSASFYNVPPKVSIQGPRENAENLISSNIRFFRENPTVDTYVKSVEKMGKKAAEHSAGWFKSFLIATAIYFLGRAVFNALFPKSQEDEPEYYKSKNSTGWKTKLAGIAGLTAGIKWISGLR